MQITKSYSGFPKSRLELSTSANRDRSPSTAGPKLHPRLRERFLLCTVHLPFATDGCTTAHLSSILSSCLLLASQHGKLVSTSWVRIRRYSITGPGRAALFPPPYRRSCPPFSLHPVHFSTQHLRVTEKKCKVRPWWWNALYRKAEIWACRKTRTNLFFRTCAH